MRNTRARKAILPLPRPGENCPQSFLLFSCFGRSRRSQSKFSCKRVQLSLLKLPSAAENVKKWCIYMNVFVKPNEQSSSLLEYSAMARKRLLKTKKYLRTSAKLLRAYGRRHAFCSKFNAHTSKKIPRQRQKMPKKQGFILPFPALKVTLPIEN